MSLFKNNPQGVDIQYLDALESITGEYVFYISSRNFKLKIEGKGDTEDDAIRQFVVNFAKELHLPSAYEWENVQPWWKRLLNRLRKAVGRAAIDYKE